MKIHFIYIISIFLLIFLISSCDEINNYRKTKTTTTSEKAIRKILLEKFTGAKCGNCPAAEKVADDLIKTNPNRIVLVELHTGVFAKPDKSKYTYDFRTVFGTELDDKFAASVVGHPNGMINRTEFNGKIILKKEEWGNAVDFFIDSLPAMKMNLTAYYNQANKNIDIYIDITYLKKSDSTNALSVYLTEDSIVKPQTDYSQDPSDIMNYVHNNVLRVALNGTWGDLISTKPITEGSIVTRHFNYRIPDGSDWKIENLKFVAFIHNDKTVNGKQIYEVLQVEETANLILVL